MTKYQEEGRALRLLCGALLIAVVLVFVMLSGCADRSNEVNIQPLTTTEQPFAEWIDQDFTPPDPLTAYDSKELSDDWTGWNKFFFAAAVGGSTADVISTRDGLDRGCKEGNPLLGDDPPTGLLILSKAAVIGLGYVVTEYWFLGDPQQQEYRNWIYGWMTVLGFGAAGWNMSVNCE